MCSEWLNDNEVDTLQWVWYREEIAVMGVVPVNIL